MSDEENAALVIKTGIEQVFAPLQKLVDQLLGPAATEVGLSLGDSVKVWRFKRQIRLLQEVKRLIELSGKDIKPIATRVFFPVLEAASIEDDDEMQTRWAALLANEATDTGSVHPSFIDVLKQLAPEEARLLDKLCDFCERGYDFSKPIREDIESSRHEFQEMRNILKSSPGPLQNLLRLGLIRPEYEIENDPEEQRLPGISRPVLFNHKSLESSYELTDFAVSFVYACRAPGGRSKSSKPRRHIPWP